MKKNGITTKSSIILLGLALPGIIYLFIMNYIPMAGILLAFKNYNARLGFFKSEWCGFRNFRFLFASQDAYRIIRNTIGYNFLFIVVTTIVAISVALLLNEIGKRTLVKIYQTTYFLPYFISWVVVGFMAKILFSYNTGILNQIRNVFGFDNLAWYQTTKPWLLILPLADIWKKVGYQSVIYYGALMSIDQEMFEAARIDGCSGLKTIRYITLPSIMPVIMILFILSIGSIMRSDFGLFYYVPNNSGTIYAVTDVIDTYIFRTLRETGDIGVTSAVGFIQAVVGALLVLFTNKIVKKFSSDNALI